MGNRGRLDPGGWSTRAWISCALDVPRDPGWKPRYSRLFFHDEAVALAAGFRPCAHCRRADSARFKAAFASAHRLPGVKLVEIDRDLRLRRSPIVVRPENLPDGVFVWGEDEMAAFLKWKGVLLRWSHAGYSLAREVRGRSPVGVITPEPVVRALSAGYVPYVRLSE